MRLGLLQQIDMGNDDFLDPRTTNALAARRGLRSPIRWARMPAGLWHYTCDDHGRDGINRDGFLRPNWESFTPDLFDRLGPEETRVLRATSAVVWMTDLDDVTAHNAETVGLASARPGSCDRTANRYRVDPNTPPGHILSFPEYLAAGAFPMDIAHALTPFPVDPARWFVAPHRVRVTAAPR